MNFMAPLCQSIQQVNVVPRTFTSLKHHPSTDLVTEHQLLSGTRSVQGRVGGIRDGRFERRFGGKEPKYEKEPENMKKNRKKIAVQGRVVWIRDESFGGEKGRMINFKPIINLL